jgi:DNA-binding Xre family transcriptional regulator
MITFNIEKLLKQQNKSKYWLCQKMNITNKNLNRIINGETVSISFKYLEDFCTYLNCSLTDLITIDKK